MDVVIATLNTYWLYDNEAPLARWGLRLPEGGLPAKIDMLVDAILQIGPGGHTTGPDILALQEVEGPLVLDALLTRLQERGSPLAYLYCSETLDPFTGQNVAFLSRFPAATAPVTRLDQTTQLYTDFRDREKSGSLGKFLRLDVEITADPPVIDIVSGEERARYPAVISLFNVHLKSRRGWGPNAVEETRFLRSAQAQIVRDLSRPRVEQGDSGSPSFTVILGDFNEELRTKPLDIMLGKQDTSYTLTPATIDLPAEEQFTYTYDGENQQLDHILLSFFTNQRKSAAGFTRIDSATSDHDAVWCVVNPFLTRSELP